MCGGLREGDAGVYMSASERETDACVCERAVKEDEQKGEPKGLGEATGAARQPGGSGGGWGVGRYAECCSQRKFGVEDANTGANLGQRRLFLPVHLGCLHLVQLVDQLLYVRP